MISRREFFSISIMMLMLLFMFQFSLVIKEHGNRYDTNEYYMETSGNSETAWQIQEIDLTTTFPVSSDYVLFIGTKKSSIGKTVYEWCNYTKRSISITNSLAKYKEKLTILPEIILIDSKYLKMETDIKILKNLAEQGTTIIFCDLPSADNLSNDEELKNLLGIKNIVSKNVELDAIKLFKGILLGGEVIYQSGKSDSEGMDFLFPWYTLESGTKTYMVGILDDEYLETNKVTNEELPAIIWRNSVGNGNVFVVNGDYMYDSIGLGFLSGFMSEIYPVDIYPVINAQNMSVANYPGFASENDDEMQKIYSRTQRSMFRDTIWPSLVSTTQNSNMKLTCFVTPQYDYMDENEPQGEELVFYLKQFKEVGAEAGLSFVFGGGITLEDKIERDNVFFSSLISNYKYGVAYISSGNVSTLLKMTDKHMLKDIGTLICKYNKDLPIVSYCSDDIVLQSTTNDGFSHTYIENLRMRSLESALGYTNVVLDMNRVVWPKGEDDHWHIISKTFSSNIETYWSKFKMFNSTTLSESGQNVKNFLNMDYDKKYEDGILTLNLTNQTGANWFILRTHGESIVDIKGATYTKIEENAYLIEAVDSNIVIELDKEEEFYYYLP